MKLFDEWVAFGARHHARFWRTQGLDEPQARLRRALDHAPKALA